MILYRWLEPRIGTPAAMIVTGLWYGLLLALILLLASDHGGNFRYDDI